MFNNKMENGQTIILVVISVFIMVVMAALIVDGGNAYMRRRQAQTAADAAALAAANEYCTNNVASTDLQPIVDEYATIQNDADTATYDFFGADSEYPKGRIVVDASLTSSTFFAKIFGRPTITVSAEAAAACFLPAEANNLIPVAWTCNVHAGTVETCLIEKIPAVLFDQIVTTEGESYFDSYLLDVGDEVTAASYIDDAYNDPPTQGKLVYMIMDDADFDENLNCKELNPPGEDLSADPPNLPGEGLITCDFDGDGIVNVQGSERGWLQLDDSLGAVSLWELMLNGYDGVLGLPQWFVASDGVKNAVFINAHEIKFRKSLVPVYNAVCPVPGSGITSTTEEDLPDDCPLQYEDGDLILPSTGGQDYFRVPGVAVFVITCVSKGNSEYCPGKDLSNVKDNTSTIEGYFLEGYVAGTAISNSGFDLGVYVLSLTE